MSKDRTLWLLGAIVVVVFFAVLQDMSVDDAYISFRYAENLGNGYGLSFNHGERVEGYTNLLWVVLLAGASIPYPDIPLLARVLSVLFCILTLRVHLDLLGLFGGGNATRPIGLALLVCSAPFLYWSQNGLETALFTFLVTLGFRLWCEGEARRPLATVVLALATLTRPEGVLVYVTLLASDLLGRQNRSVRPWNPALVASVAGFLLFLVGYEAWRWLYFGSWLPNTYIAKVGGLPTLAGGLARLGRFMVAGGGLLYLAALVLLLVRGRPARRGPMRHLVALVAVYLAYLVYTGGDIYYLFRYYVPLIPLLTVVLARAVVEWVPETGRRGRVAAGTLITILLGGYLASPLFVGRDAGARTLSRAADRGRVEIGEWMRDNLPAESSVALNAIGIIPYITGFETYDMVGLTDVHIARLPMNGKRLGARGHWKYDGEYILGRNPDYILLSNAVPLNIMDQSRNPIRVPTRLPMSALLPLFRQDFPFLPGDEEIFGSSAFTAGFESWVVPLDGGGNFILFKRRERQDVLSGRAGRN